MNTQLQLTPPANFNLRHTIFSHGWYALPPFYLDKATERLRRVLTLPSGKHVLVTLSGETERLSLEVTHKGRLSAADQADIIRQVRDLLRLDEDYEAFYKVAGRSREFAWVKQLRAGRLLRSPTLFEDVVKMLCTTNCSWSATEKMVGALVRQLGMPCQGDYYAFPTPAQIAAVSEQFLREQIRLGYRAPYLLELATAVASGQLPLESWKTSELPTQELYQRLRCIKGIGAYAAGNILKLLGRYDYLALDSWCRMKYSQLRQQGQPVDDQQIAAAYAPYQQWQGLFMWLDVTKDWYFRAPATDPLP